MRVVTILALWSTLLLAGTGQGADAPPLRPQLVGQPWQIASNPDLGELNGAKQQVVDFGIWQAGDGAWQCWSCIRGTKEPGQGRVLYRWQGAQLTDTNWQPLGIALRADANWGEVPGGLQAPFVFRDGPKWQMFYGGWDAIFAAASDDGKTFARRAKSQAEQAQFVEKGDNPRDPMLLKIGSLWHCYYTAFPGRKGAVYCRTSSDLTDWSEPRLVARGGQAGDGPFSAECPFVVEVRTGVYLLFRTQRYGADAQTSVYTSGDPLDFGLDRDEGHFVGTLPVAAPEIIRHHGQDYIAFLLPNLQGIQIAHLNWIEAK